MIIPKFTGKIVKGKLIIDRQQDFEIYLTKLCGDVEVTVCRPRKEKSNQELRYYFGVIIEILRNELGYTVEEMHEALKWKFLRTHEDKIPTVRSLADLSTVEAENYFTQIREFASIELGIFVPTPNEVSY